MGTKESSSHIELSSSLDIGEKHNLKEEKEKVFERYAELYYTDYSLERTTGKRKMHEQCYPSF